MEQNFLTNLYFMFSYVFHDRIVVDSKNFPSENDGNLYNLRAPYLLTALTGIQCMACIGKELHTRKMDHQ